GVEHSVTALDLLAPRAQTEPATPDHVGDGRERFDKPVAVHGAVGAGAGLVGRRCGGQEAATRGDVQVSETVANRRPGPGDVPPDLADDLVEGVQGQQGVPGQLDDLHLHTLFAGTVEVVIADVLDEVAKRPVPGVALGGLQVAELGQHDRADGVPASHDLL